MDINFTCVIWTCHTFKNNFGIKHKLAKYLKESCRQSSDEQFSLKYFLYIVFVREISLKLHVEFWTMLSDYVSIPAVNGLTLNVIAEHRVTCLGCLILKIILEHSMNSKICENTMSGKL